MRKILSNLLFIILFVVLIYSVFEMPTNLELNSPSYNEIAWHYINNGANETNASNIVAAILADYRGFDTLGETIVLFTSVVAVGSVLRSTKYDKEIRKHE
ncbi:MAG: hydrogen gas-evolving membrane-bound hydrogenase subunit E [Candidatus Izemoplasmatales bacterium]